MIYLEAVARRFAERGPLDRVCFVFPNRRAGTFFKRWLGRTAGKPVFVPNVLTIDELFSKIAGIRETQEKARLLYILYQEYIHLMPGSAETGPESFDDFIYWGDILLSDFDDFDKYLVEVDKLLINLRQLKELSTDYEFLKEDQKRAIAAFCGSFFAGKMPDQAGHDEVEGSLSRRKFAEIWNVLLPLYHAFRSALAEEKCAYAGMIYRNVAESLPAAGTLLPQYDEIVFIGLNALNACEKKLLDHFRKEGRGDFYWDFAGPMVTDPDNLAGKFIRENLKNYPPKEPFECPVRDPKQQHFEVIRVPSAVGQTRKAMQILQELQEQDKLKNPEQTAVVLPDENLLFPMLGAVPESIEKINVTMGYALSASSGATLFQWLERLQNNRRIYHERPSFYHRDVTGILEHPFFAAAADPAAIAATKNAILLENRIYVPVETLASQGGVFADVFRIIDNTHDIPAYLCGIIEAVQQAQPPLEREFLYRFHETVTDLAQSGLPLETLEPRTWYRLLAQYTALVKIPFQGEPLSGLQIMGPLETRALDFDTVIMLSVGEGIFPSRSISASFIPYNLRLGFGLPTYEQQDAMWSYYFYRSICRAERVYLLYDSRTEGLQSGEESRFIKQLKYLYDVHLTEKVATYAIAESATESPMCHVAKDAAVMQKLEDLFVTGKSVFSASSLNTYLNCPLRFYYEFVEGIREQDEVVEDLDPGLFGTIFHAVMEKLYKPFEGRLVREKELDEKILFGPKAARLDAMVVAEFAENHIREIAGQNLILKELIIHLVKRVVQVDRALAAKGSFQVIEVEKPVGLRVTLPQSKRSVQLFGYIDRLDSHQRGIVRIVDYKTGKVKKDKCKSVEELFDTTKGMDRAYIAFQLYFYALLMNRLEPRPEISYRPCIYSLRSVFTKEIEDYSVEASDLDEFEERLLQTIEEIFDPEKPFEPHPESGGDSDDSVCKYCNFKRLCNKA